MTLCSVARIPRSDTSHHPVARAAGSASRARAFRSNVESVPHHIACASLVDPHDETLEIEITEDMVNLALEAVDGEQVWPYAADPGLVARPCRCAQIIRFPGC